jgi:O-antigen/teichoic acid export membrane protein
MPVFFGILLASTAISRMDIFILSRFVSLELIGQYAVAAKIFEITGMVSAVAVTTIYPAFSKLYVNDGKRFNDVFAFAFKWALLLATPTFLLLLVPLDDAILLVFGNSFKLAADLAPWLFFAALFVALSQALSMGFLVQHSQKLDFFALAIGLFITFFFVLAGAMWSGAVGAAKAMLISYFVQFSIRIGLFSRNDSGRHLLKTIAAPCLAILIAGACWLSLGSDARLVEVIVVVAVYILIVWFSKAITPADVMEFRTLVSARTR